MPALALFVDASYLHAQVGKALGGAPRPKRAPERVAEAQVVVERLLDAACRMFGLTRADVLRLYWYESARDGTPNAAQRCLGLLDDVRLRVGPVGARTLSATLGHDLGALAAQRAISHAVLLSADADLLPVLAQVQLAGVHLGLLGLGGQDADAQELNSGQGSELCLAVDRVRSLDVNDWTELYQWPARSTGDAGSTRPVGAATPEPIEAQGLRSAVQDFWNDLGQTPAPQDLSPSIAPELDRALLNWVRQRVGRLLDDGEKRIARAHFRSLAQV